MMRKKRISIVSCFLICSFLFAQTGGSNAFREAQQLLAQHYPDKAIPLLYAALNEGVPQSEVGLYLGLAYMQLAKYAEAQIWLSKGLETATKDKHLYLYNVGNAFYMQDLFEQAEFAYSNALSALPTYTPAFLNRANAYLKQEKFEQALSDYRTYLALEPNSAQKAAIQRMIALLEQQIANEKMRLATEAYERQLATERYEQMMQTVQSTLTEIESGDALSADAEGTIDYLEDYELE